MIKNNSNFEKCERRGQELEPVPLSEGGAKVKKKEKKGATD